MTTTEFWTCDCRRRHKKDPNKYVHSSELRNCPECDYDRDGGDTECTVDQVGSVTDWSYDEQLIRRQDGE